jgi:hypothetical protein
MGTTSRQVETKASAKELTLGELREFIASLDQAGAANTTPIRGRANWNGTLKSVRATAVRFGDPARPNR